MKIATWNVNGLRSAETKFLAFLERHQPDIIGLQEVKASPDDLPFTVKIPDGYVSDFDWCKYRRGYSGVGLYFRTAAFKNSRPKTVVGIGEERFDKEGRVVTVENKDITVVNAYFPFGGGNRPARLDYKMNFCEAVYNYVVALKNEGKRVILMGDINIARNPEDLYSPAAYANTSVFLPIEREWLEKFLALGFVDCFRKFEKSGGHYTWWPYTDPTRVVNNGLRIDYIFADKSLDEGVVTCEILKEQFGSDHCPVIAEIKL